MFSLFSACIDHPRHKSIVASPILGFCVGHRTVLLPQVKPQLTLVSEVKITVFAMIRLLSGVNAHVALEGLQVAEVSAADLTRVRLLSSVD